MNKISLVSPCLLFALLSFGVTAFGGESRNIESSFAQRARHVAGRTALTKRQLKDIDRAGYAGNAMKQFFSYPEEFCRVNYKCRARENQGTDSCVVFEEKCRFSDVDLNHWLEDHPRSATAKCFDSVNASGRREYDLCDRLAITECDRCFEPVPGGVK